MMNIWSWLIALAMTLIMEYIRESNFWTAIWHSILMVGSVGMLILIIRWDLNREGW